MWGRKKTRNRPNFPKWQWQFVLIQAFLCLSSLVKCTWIKTTKLFKISGSKNVGTHFFTSVRKTLRDFHSGPLLGGTAEVPLNLFGFPIIMGLKRHQWWVSCLWKTKIDHPAGCLTLWWGAGPGDFRSPSGSESSLPQPCHLSAWPVNNYQLFLSPAALERHHHNGRAAPSTSINVFHGDCWGCLPSIQTAFQDPKRCSFHKE